MAREKCPVCDSDVDFADLDALVAAAPAVAPRGGVVIDDDDDDDDDDAPIPVRVAARSARPGVAPAAPAVAPAPAPVAPAAAPAPAAAAAPPAGGGGRRGAGAPAATAGAADPAVAPVAPAAPAAPAKPEVAINIGVTEVEVADEKHWRIFVSARVRNTSELGLTLLCDGNMVEEFDALMFRQHEVILPRGYGHEHQITVRHETSGKEASQSVTTKTVGWWRIDGHVGDFIAKLTKAEAENPKGGK